MAIALALFVLLKAAALCAAQTTLYKGTPMTLYGLRLTAITAGFFVLSGCISQRIDPVQTGKTLAPEICMIEKTTKKVRQGFTDTYRAVLQEKGFTVRQLPPASNPSDCYLSTQYTARWSRDFAIYMAYAEINVYEEGRLVGKALYDARKAGLALTKFIIAEDKIRELVDELFPQEPR